ncbi:MAG: hypothetical protein LBB38_03860 [Puniceicoccales bacterium]|jgi:hypothetical protein|nr:hypothetical protein [Puniceicoccales bacterium]
MRSEQSQTSHRSFVASLFGADRKEAETLIATAVKTIDDCSTINALDVEWLCAHSRTVERLLLTRGKQLSEPEKVLLFVVQKSKFLTGKRLEEVQAKLNGLLASVERGEDPKEEQRLTLPQVRTLDGFVHHLTSRTVTKTGAINYKNNELLVAVLTNIADGTNMSAWIKGFAATALLASKAFIELEHHVFPAGAYGDGLARISFILNSRLRGMGVGRFAHLTAGEIGHVEISFNGQEMAGVEDQGRVCRVFGLKELAQTSFFALDFEKLISEDGEAADLLRLLKRSRPDVDVRALFRSNLELLLQNDYGFRVTTFGVIFNFLLWLYNFLVSIFRSSPSFHTPISEHFAVDDSGNVRRNFADGYEFKERSAICSGYIATVIAEALRLTDECLKAIASKCQGLTDKQRALVRSLEFSFAKPLFRKGTRFESVSPKLIHETLARVGALGESPEGRELEKFVVMPKDPSLPASA